MSLRHSRELVACLQRISELDTKIKEAEAIPHPLMWQSRHHEALIAARCLAVARLDALRRDLPIQDEKGRLKGRRVNNQRKTS